MKNNLKNISKKLSISLLTGVILFSSFPVEALTKNETVFTKLDNKGIVKSVLVNEHLENNKKLENLKDYSTLKNILNINNDSTYVQNKNVINWNANGSDIFYTGTTEEALPVSVNISYKLDGKNVKADDIIGKSGNITITMKYKNSDKHVVSVNGKKETLYTPFVVTMGMMLDSNNNSNVSVENGKVMNTGTKDAIIGIAAPGLYESLYLKEIKGLDTITITFDTTKFELPTIYSVVTPKLIDNSDLKVFDKLDTIYNSVNTLQSGMNKLEKGARAVSDGSSKLKSELSSSIKTLSSDNSDALTSSQVSQFIAGAKSGVNATFTNDYVNGIKSATWSSVKSGLENSNDDTVSNYGTAILATYLGGTTNLQMYGACKQGMTSYCDALEASGYEIDKIDALASSINTNLNKSVMYVAKNVSDQVSSSLSKKVALDTAESVASNLVPTVANTVKNGTMQAVSSGLGDLYNGVVELDNGIKSLSKGISKINTSGIKKISSLVNSNVRSTSNRMKALIKLSNNYESFGGKLDSDKGETKFIFVIDSLNDEEEVKISKTETKNTSFGERVTNLFK